ncbi:valine--tRNA ligase [Candidatus Parcubacteria bacterium]|nr:MAG: valine--tRNA ligase [Candidatus Parcubacteria bacterium]
MANEAYNHLGIEEPIYKRWEASGFFNPDNLPDKRKKVFSISMPPPNVTGELHLGHATGMTIQDILTRYHRMAGFKALWLPGTDHAGIATQIMVERLLQTEGISRHEIGRETFLKHVWAWKQKYGTRITDQIKSLGASCDWSREHFTMDPNLTQAVQKAFIILFKAGLIYRGERLINWCTRCQTALSDLEVKHKDIAGHLYFIKYGQLTVATTRPETKLGDTALAVNPKDKRYKKFIGKKITFETESGTLTLPVIADRLVDPKFGTGVIKVTPAHDPADWEMGERHKLAIKQVIGEDNRMTKLAGNYAGMLATQARDKIIADLQAKKLLIKIEPYTASMPHCDRCGSIVQPLISKQWFLKIGPLAKPAMAAVKSGKIQFVPKRFEKVYFHWMKNIRDWCISRQLWWGHQIPVWYCTDHFAIRLNCPPIASVAAPKKCKCGGTHFVQDQDTLDTWFSSGLWTFSTLGWPQKTKDLKLFHPTSVMETAWDILFFWVARMIMFSLKFTRQIPFKKVFIHGLVLDKEGKKMSKSKGTGIDPLPMAEKYGTDAIRLSLVLGTAPGQDFRLSEEKIAGYRNFINKLWNIGNFIDHRSADNTKGAAPKASLADQWILNKNQALINLVTTDINNFRFSEAGQALYDFIWHELADWYVETQKIQPNQPVLLKVYEDSLKLLHPFAPFVTEALWARLKKKDLLLIAEWPRAEKPKPSPAKDFEKIQKFITQIRNFRALHKITPAEKVPVYLEGTGTKLLLANREIVEFLSRAILVPTAKLAHKAHGHEAGVNFWLEVPKANLAQVKKALADLKAYIQSQSAKLQNQNFLKNAPAPVVKNEKRKLAAAREKLKKLSA